MRHEETDMPLLPGERVDETGFGALKLIQKPEEFCYGVDAVLLADFGAKYARPSFRFAVDLGTGTGIAPPILAGIEVQEGSFDRAVRSRSLNGLEDRLDFVLGDVKDCKSGW